MGPHSDSIMNIFQLQSTALRVCQVIHSVIGHFGAGRMVAYACRYVYCLGLSDWIQWVCRECQKCALHKGLPECTTSFGISTSEPFELVTMNFLTVAETTSGYQYAMVFADHFSKLAKLCVSVILLSKENLSRALTLSPRSFLNYCISAI